MTVWTFTFAPRGETPDTYVFTTEESALKFAAKEIAKDLKAQDYADDAKEVRRLLRTHDYRAAFDEALACLNLADRLEYNVQLKRHDSKGA